MIFFNPKFLEALTIDETLFVLLHELLHITLDHIGRRGLRNRRKFNIAADVVVNDILIHTGFDNGTLPMITGKQFKIDGVIHTVEEVYEILDINVEDYVVMNHELWNDEFRDGVKKILNDSQKKGFSDSSNFFNRVISSSFTQKRCWKTILNNLLSSNEKDYSFERVNEITKNVLLPTFNKQEYQLENIWMLVDVSGSMNDNEVVNAYAEISSVINSFESVELNISFFSTFLTKPIKVKSIKSLKESFNVIKSGGGTSFDIIFEELNNFNKLPIAIIIITDGHARIPREEKAKGIPVFWAINNNEITPNFGNIIRI